MSNLLKNEPFLRKAIPHLKPEYFTDSNAEKLIFDEIKIYTEKYKQAPSITALTLSLGNRTGVSETDCKLIEECLKNISSDEEEHQSEWLNDATEKFCQEKAIYNAILSSIHILDGKSKEDKGAIPELLTKALSVSFDPNVGHDYLEDSDARYDYYHRKSTKYPFNIEKFNIATNGGVEPKTLNVFLAGPKIGKSLIMCHFAAGFLSCHHNVLYITLEMSAEKIAQRIDANLLDTPINDLVVMEKGIYDKKIESVKQRARGKLIVKEYPTAAANANHFRALINDLWLKKQFKPNIIFIDYLNICTSTRMKLGSGVNSYSYIKSICEELRGLAVEMNVPLFSATQLTRAGFKNSDPEMDDTSESFGLPMTVDELWVATSTDELRAVKKLAFKKLASRSSDVGENKRWLTGVDYSRMKLLDVDEGDQSLTTDFAITPKKSDYDKFKFD